MNAAKLARLQERVRRRNQAEPVPALEIPTEKPIALDEHFTVTEVATLWHMNPKTVRRIFASMEGVIKLGEGKKTLFIPKRLLEQKHRELAS
jgi:AraC-like DNA-binding protein